MANKTEPAFREEFIVTEANGNLSRESVTIISGQNLKAGAALGKITASGKYTALNPGAGTGEQTFAGVLCHDVDASGGDKAGSIIIGRLAELNKEEIGWNTMTAPQIATAITQALTLNIAIRSAI